MKLRYFNIFLKASLVVMLVVAQATHAVQFQGKGMGWRLVFYPLGVMIVPIVYAIYKKRGYTGSYPEWTDVLITLPFVIDTAGNWLNLFDTITWWDDAMHFFLWGCLMAGIATLAMRSRNMQPWYLFFIVAGMGAFFAVFWELGEYIAFVQNNPSESITAYRDTMGDLVLGTTGGTISAAVAALILRRNQLSKNVAL